MRATVRHLVRLAAAAVVVAAASDAVAAAKVRAGAVQPITVDGSVADWHGVPVQYFDSGPRVTAIAHDDRFLYVQFRFSDLALARRVLRTGAIVWVCPARDHDASFGLRYRGTAAMEQALREADSQGTGAPTELGPPPDASQRGAPEGPGAPPERAPLGALEVLRYGVVDEVIAGGAQPDGHAAAGGVADGVFAWELRIPLSEVSSAAGLNPDAKSGKIAIGFQMSGMTAAEREAMRERMRPSGGPGGGGPRGGGAPPGGGGPPEGGGWGGHGGPPQGGRPEGGREGKGRGSEIVWVEVEIENGQAGAPGDQR